MAADPAAEFDLAAMSEDAPRNEGARGELADGPALRPFARLSAWGADLAGDRRIFAYGGVGGIAFGIIVYGTVATAVGMDLRVALQVPRGVIAALGSVALFGVFWTLLATFAYAGWTRIFLSAAIGHLLGYVIMSVNLAAASAFDMDASLAFVSLFGFTFLGFVAGATLEALLHTGSARAHANLVAVEEARRD